MESQYETQRMAMQRLYETGTDFNQAPLRVNPNYPLPSSLPALHGPSQNSLTNGVARTTSKRRRPSATGSGRTPADKFSQPPAPEVPKAPPIAYRPPYSSEIQSHPVGHYPASFAERARALTANSIPTVPDPHSEPETTPQPARRERRGSLNRPIGGLYSEIQKHRRDSYPPPNGPISPRRFSNTTNPEQYENLDANSPSQKASPAVAHQYTISSPVQTLSSPRGAPVGLEKPPRKEWAPDRSPLQKLEIKLSDISKEEKRARVEEAEQRLRESKARDRGSKFVREVEPIVARNSSRQVSADAAAANSSKLSDHTQRLQEDTNGQRPPANRMEANIIPQPEKPSNQSTSGSYPQRTSEGISIDFYQPLSGDRSRKASASATKTSQSDQQLGRGVRFQGEEDTGGHGAYSPDSNQMDSRSRGRNCGMEALARSDEVQSARQDKLRQKPSSTANQSSSKQIPVGQKELYNGKPLNSHECSPAARHRGLLDPVPRNSVQSDSQVPKYEVPPQTAAVVGSGSGPQQVTEVPAHRKHHLSAILNRGHKHAVDTYEQTNSRPGNLDEWKYGGTARLTAADFITEEEPDDKNRAWWEKGNSDPRRKPGRVREAQPPRNHLQTENGKIPSPIFPRATKAEWPPSHDRAPRTRQYLEPDQYLRIGRAPDPYHESHVPHFLHRTKNEQALRLSSVYSYSCPNLADHVPAHSSHVCEPYLSKELTLSMRSVRIRPAPALATFDPPLYLKSGPLLRYTGLRRDRLQTKSRSGPSSSERETWRGSVMIVTADADSSYDPAPILRLFPEPMDHLPTPPQHVEAQNGHDLPSEYIDPIAGLPKLSRSGKTVYVKPVDDLEQGVDLSRVENDDGLFEEFRTAAVPTAYGTPDFRPGRNTDPSLANRTSRKGQQVRGVRLHAERGVTFWRFNLEVELGVQQTRVAYSINKSPSVGFWIPGRGQSMNVMFHSCNGFSMSVNPDNFSGPDPLWRDVLNCHQTRPFHVMIGGGDQIYNDAVMSQSPLFRDWLEIKNPHHKSEVEFSPSMREELETFYLERYSMWFSQGLFGMANAQIPMVNMWDDHDIIDGFGSYPHHFMSAPVFCGLGAVAFKYYMLFQHQSVPDETASDEPSWLTGAAPGPYINELSRSIFLSLGKNVALLALDCRTERMREEILSEASYELIFDRCRREINEGETKHLIVLLGVPIAYPRLVWLENLITSRVMDPVKALGRAGILGGFLNKFDGGVEILDDLDDHWTAKNHKRERNWFIQELQELAAEKSVRVTIVGGDVHLAAIGQFYSNPKLGIPKDRDHRYMANVVSSAIVNTPPPTNMADILNKRNKTHHLDNDTDEDMIPMFTHDVNGRPRNNKHLLPRRNWCSIREYQPGSTPPPTPPSSEPQTPSDESPPPPTRLHRTLSLTRGDVKPGNLIRRLSGRGPPSKTGYQPSNRYDNSDSPTPPPTDGYFPHQPDLPQKAATINGGNGGQRYSSAPLPRPGNFHRRPTNISEKAAAKGGDIDDLTGHINLEHGLDIVLNCEVNQKDPAGITVPYRLLIPALWYEGEGDINMDSYRKKSIFSRLPSIKRTRKNTFRGGQGQGNWGQQESRDPSESDGESEEVRPRRWSFGVSQRRQYRDQTPPVERGYGEERPQQQRQFEDRNQQIGQAKQPQQQQFTTPPRQERHHGELRQQQGQFQYHEDERHDSIDYHQQLNATPPPQQNSAYPGQRLSKVDRMLGVGPLARANSSSGNGAGNLEDHTDNQKDAQVVSYENDDFDDEPRNFAHNSQGYSGIEAYSEKKEKGWKRFLKGLKDVEEKSSGRR